MGIILVTVFEDSFQVSDPFPWCNDDSDKCNGDSAVNDYGHGRDCVTIYDDYCD